MLTVFPSGNSGYKSAEDMAPRFSLFRMARENRDMAGLAGLRKKSPGMQKEETVFYRVLLHAGRQRT
jgi:hypothetical protein